MSRSCLLLSVLPLLLYLHSALCRALPDATTSHRVPITVLPATINGQSRTYIQTTAPTERARDLPQEEYHSVSTPYGNCSLDTAPLCPTCNGWFSVSEFRNYEVECDTMIENATYYEDCNATTISECLDSAYDSALRYYDSDASCQFGDPIWGNGTCLIPCTTGSLDLAYIPGWAYIAPKFTGALPTHGSEIEVDCDLGTTQLCPQCNELSAEDGPLSYTIRCNTFWGNATYYKDMNATNPDDCLKACTRLECCEQGILWDTEICLLPCGNELTEVSSEGWTFISSPDVKASHFTCKSSSVAAPSRASRGVGIGQTPEPLPVQNSTRILCTPAAAICPDCNGTTLLLSDGKGYRIDCDSYLTSSSGSTGAGHILLSFLDACDVSLRCNSATFEPGGTCDTNYKTTKPLKRKNNIGLTQVLQTASSIPILSKYSNSSSPSTSGKCSASLISCPDCNGERIKDDTGKFYTVGCGKSIFSESHYAVERGVGPSKCIEECDAFQGCKGATWWPDGNCELATGEDSFPQDAPSKKYIGFLPYDPMYTSEPPHLSAFPTGAFTPVSTASKPNASPSCNPSAITCQSARWLR